MKSKTKKLLSMLLAALTVASLALPAIPAKAATISGSCGANLTYSLSGGVLTIDGTGPMTSFAGVKSVPWYNYMSEIRTVYFKDVHITSIGPYAFKDAVNLTSVYLNEGPFMSESSAITSIGNHAFSGCTALKTLEFPVNASVQVGSFTNCDNITKVIMIPQVKFSSSDSYEYVRAGKGYTSDTAASYTPWRKTKQPVTVVFEERAYVLTSGYTNHIGPYTFCNQDNLTVDLRNANPGLTIDATNFTGCTNARVYMPCDAYYTSSLTGKVTLIKDHGRITGTAAYRAPTCTQKGVNGYSYCADCKTYFSGSTVYGKDYQSVTIPALGHDLQFNDRAEPTETKNGHIAYYSCSRCDACFSDAAGATAISEEDYLLPTTGHLPSEGVVVQAPTCSSDGRMKYTCPGCGEEYYEVIPALSHTPVEYPAVKATCTETGLTAGSHCSLCEAVLEEQQVVPALGHTPVEDPAVEATCTETGLTAGSHCSLCGAVLEEQQEVPAVGHTPEDVPGKEASCTESGLTAGSRCSACGAVLVEQENIPAPGHHYENAFCRVCGAVLKGDVTLDGVITVKDVSLLYSMYVGRTEAIEELITIADMNGDGRISLIDVCLVYVLSW